MVLGAIWCNNTVQDSLKDRMKLIKRQFNIPAHREIKWTKISPAKLDYYRAIINLFFEEENINFRAVVIPKSILRHQDFDQKVGS